MGTDAYYEDLAGKYLYLARRYVRRYDELVQLVADTVLEASPSTVLDVGQGPGHIDQMILDRNPSVHIDCIDAQEGMVNVARRALAAYGERVSVVHADVRQYQPERQYDVVLCNLVIHNIPYDQKLEVLKAIYQHLEAGKPFIWGDMVGFEDPQKVKAAFDARKRFAVSNGEDPESEFFRTSFHKEEHSDYTLTPEQTMDLMKQAGFQSPRQIWEYDNFALFIAQK